MKNLSTAAILFLLSATAFAGTARFTGQGHLSSPPEYVEVTVNVSSLCYSDINDARDATNDAVNQILELFKTIVDPTNPKDSAHTNGGTTSISSGHRVAGSNVLACVSTFKKVAKVTLLTTDLAGFEENFQAIEDLVYGELSGVSTSAEEPLTVATLKVPVAHVFSETVERVSIQALSQAMTNSKDKFKILMDAGCGVHSYRIDSAVEPHPSANIRNPYAGTRGIPRPGSGSGSPVMFGDVWITKALDVTFDFQGGDCTELNPV
jgi:hypothetical protein